MLCNYSTVHSLFERRCLLFVIDVQLAIEQRRKEMQERENLRAENQRLLAMEQQYVETLKHLEFERDQLEHEKTKVQILQQQQQNVANEFDRNVSIQIEQLKIQKQELSHFEYEKKNILEREKEIEMAASQLDAQRKMKVDRKTSEHHRILEQQASLDLQEFQRLEKTFNDEKSSSSEARKKAIELETDKHALALLELDILTDDLEFQDRYQTQKEDIENEKHRLLLMENQHKELEKNLSQQITRLLH